MPRSLTAGLRQPGGTGADLAAAGQEGQDVPFPLLNGPHDRTRHLLRQRGMAAPFEEDLIHRIRPAGRGQQRGITQQPGQRSGFQGGGHDQDLQVRSHLALDIQCQGQAKVGLQAALVELVEDQQRHPFQQRIVLDAAGQDPFGHDLDPGCRGDPAVKSDAVSDGLPQLLPQASSHPAGSRDRRQAARLQHDDLSGFCGDDIKQRQRDAGGLAGAGGGVQDAIGVAADGVQQFGKDVVDGEM